VTYFALGLGGLVLVAVALRLFAGANPKTLSQIFRWSLITLAVVLALLLFLRGQTLFAMIPAGIAAIAWRALGFVPMGAWYGLFQMARGRARARRFSASMAAGAAGGAAARQSDIETAWLRMALDHRTGEISGEVRQGAFGGQRLGDLDQDQLFDLLDECAAHDPQSVPLLETYLDRARGADWRAAYQRRAGAASGPAAGPMTRDEAYEVLGLRAGASLAEIKEAHRALMLKNHPDRGGSDYLAAKINHAKDTLLGA
jgi:hypothetical protein